MNMLWWIFCGAAGLWIGMPNPVASFPVAALLYPNNYASNSMT